MEGASSTTTASMVGLELRTPPWGSEKVRCFSITLGIKQFEFKTVWHTLPNLKCLDSPIHRKKIKDGSSDRPRPFGGGLILGLIVVGLYLVQNVNQTLVSAIPEITRRPASADRTARRQFQATGQPLSRTQASDIMTSRLPRYEAKCVQRRYCQWGSVPLRSDIKGTELPPCKYINTTRKAIDCATTLPLIVFI